MKIKTHIAVTIIAIGHLAAPVATTHAGGITPVPKLIVVTEASAVIVEDSAGNSDDISPNPPRHRAGVVTGRGQTV